MVDHDKSTYFAMLDLVPGATKEEIKKAYHDLAKQYHPDFNVGNPEAEQKFKEINEAYAAIKDEGEEKKDVSGLDRYFRMLGISSIATDQEIEKAYHRLKLRYHPDSGRNDEAAKKKLAEITEAYNKLRGDQQDPDDW